MRPKRSGEVESKDETDKSGSESTTWTDSDDIEVAWDYISRFMRPKTSEGKKQSVEEQSKDNAGKVSNDSYWPVYNSPDAAAYGFAQMVSKDKQAENTEHSSILYFFKGKDDKNYYSFTIPLKFQKKDLSDNNSPSAAQIRNYNLIPEGAIDFGYIHNHTFNNEPDGNIWGPVDDKIAGTAGLSLYFLNSAGKLNAYRASSKQTRTIAEGFKNNPTNINITNGFNFGDGKDVSSKNYYDVH